MLKPKKKITKKEIQRDPFLETIDQAQSHLKEKKSIYLKVAVGLVILLIGFKVITEKNSQKNSDASGALGQVLVALERGDDNNAQFQLETVITKFTGTQSAKIAGYHLGKMKYESGDHTGAEIYLSQFLNDQVVDIMESSAAFMLADISAQAGDINTAISLLDKGIQKSKDDHTHRMLELEKAKLILAQGDYERARTIADGIISEKNVTPVQKQVAEEILGKIPG